ncbi:MAG: hypothetical protein J6T74_01465 [Clostridia bacterium]|nr:hypothetical protein [Clostridia bacterium]
MIVCKFGGTSVAGENSALNIKKIINGDKNRKFIVVSALGKNKQFNTKITDLLLEIYEDYINKFDYLQKLDEFFLRYQAMSERLNVNIEWEKIKQKLLKEFNANIISKEYLVSRGEYYCALMYSKYLNAKFLDAKDFIAFKKDNKLDFFKTRAKLKKLNKTATYVMGGFYGGNSKSQIVLFDRGGADITGAVVAKALNAEVYENYTDVDGVYDKNPNVFDGAKSIPIIDYITAKKMAENGNEIVHVDALGLLLDTNIILLIKSTKDYKKLGTVVTHGNLFIDKYFICNGNCLLLILDKLNKKTKQEINKFADILSCYYYNKKYYVLLKNSIKQIGYYLNKGLYIQNVVVTKIFANISLNKKTRKILQKIKKKLKNYSIFCEFTEHFNNFTIICLVDNYNIVKKCLNKYL